MAKITQINEFIESQSVISLVTGELQFIKSGMREGIDEFAEDNLLIDNIFEANGMFYNNQLYFVIFIDNKSFKKIKNYTYLMGGIDLFVKGRIHSCILYAVDESYKPNDIVVTRNNIEAIKDGFGKLTKKPLKYL